MSRSWCRSAFVKARWQFAASKCRASRGTFAFAKRKSTVRRAIVRLREVHRWVDLSLRDIGRISPGNGDRQVYWGIRLDQDLLETIVAIYPEWFKDYNLNLMAEPGGGDGPFRSASSALGGVPSPPKAQVDEASLQQAMDKNKESLKVKLMLRRPISQLVEQGIMPSLKTSPAFHEQRRNLERAKMGDYLKNKIQRRPDRQELIQQHILEDTTVDPSLQDKQRQLKKARLADGLNDRLSHRPGPLELVKGNILQAEESFAQAVKEGQIPFRRTCEGETRKHPFPFLADEDSGGSDSLLPSPGQDSNDQSQSSPPSTDLSEPSRTESPPPAPPSEGPAPSRSPAPSPPSLPVATTLCPSHRLQYLGSNVVVAAATPVPTVFLAGGGVPNAPLVQQQQAGGGKAARKKSKSKSQPKARTIKFHEYKGPPSAQKSQHQAQSSAESSYELLLQQQQLFLQLQLEWQQKYPQIILPASQKLPSVGDRQTQGVGSPPPPPPPPPAVSPGPTSTQDAARQQQTAAQRSKLEDMKVSDLKAELKRRNLPVSGSKPQLIERLKPYAEAVPPPSDVSRTAEKLEPAELSPDSSTLGLGLDVTDSPPSVLPMEVDGSVSDRACRRPESPSASGMDVDVPPVESDAKLDQRRIEELQRELERSQLQLQQQQCTQPSEAFPRSAVTTAAFGAASCPLIPPAGLRGNISPADSKALQRQLIQQHLQNKIQQQQMQQHGPNATVQSAVATGTTPSSAAVRASLANFLQQHQPQSGNQGSARTAALPVACQAKNAHVPNGHHPRSVPLPGFPALLATKQTDGRSFVVGKRPPDYDEATKHLDRTKGRRPASPAEPSRADSVKSQDVDDVLEILIKNGELPPSAAQDPPSGAAPDPASPSPFAEGTPVAFPTPPPSSEATNHDEASPAPSFPCGGETPPPSASLDFDFHLDLDDFDAIDALGCNGDASVRSGVDSAPARDPALSMEIELSDWLDVMMPQGTTTTSNQTRATVNGLATTATSCSSSSGHDPLLSTNVGDDPLDFFAMDDVDLRAWDFRTAWDGTDFIT